MTSYHARSGPGRTEALLAHLRAGADLALVTDAGTPAVSDPGGELVAAWAGGGRHGRAAAGRIGRAGGRRRLGGRRAALGVRGVPAALGARASRAAGAHRRRRARHRAVRGAGTGDRDARGTWPRPAAASAPARCAASSRRCTRRFERGTLGELAEAASDGPDPAARRVRAGGRAGRRPDAVGRRRGRGGGRRSRPRSPRSSGWWPRGRPVARPRNAWPRTTGIPRRRLYGADPTR